MFTARVTGVIELPLAQVFGFVADFRNTPRWQATLVTVHLADGTFAEGGRRVVEIHRFMGMRIKAVGDVIDWRPPDGFTVAGGPAVLRVESRYQFAAEGAATRITIDVTMDPRGPMRLAEPVLRARLRRRLAPAFAELARVLATGGAQVERE